MILLSLLFYLILWLPTIFLISIKFHISLKLFFLLSFLLICVSFGLAYLLMYLIHNFNPEKKTLIKNIISLRGIRPVIFVTLVVGLISLIAVIFFNTKSYIIYGYIVPILIASFLDFAKVQIGSKFFESEQPSPTIITLPPITPVIIDGDITKTFFWNHDNKDYEMTITMRKDLYEKYKSKDRCKYLDEYAKEYIANGICSEVREVSYNLLKIGQPYGTYKEVSFVMAFVQQAIEYAYDEVKNGDYPKYPLETLFDGKGDCEDVAILGASLLKLMGYDVALLFVPGHAAMGVAGVEGLPGIYAEYGGIKYYYCEMTSAGWEIGKLPEEYKPEEIEVHPIPGLSVELTLQQST